MKITKDPLMDSWELAESDQGARRVQVRGLVPCEKTRILIADDEESVRRVTTLVLKKDLGPAYEYDYAVNGEDAVRQFTQYHHKVILIDLSMPILGGEQAADQIVDICEDAKWEVPSIIFRTGYDPPQNIRNIVSCDSAHCLLRKPVRNQTLVMAVRRRLGLK